MLHSFNAKEVIEMAFQVASTVTAFLIIVVGAVIIWSYIWFELIIKRVFTYFKLYDTWFDFIWHRKRIMRWVKEFKGSIDIQNVPTFDNDEDAMSAGLMTGCLYKNEKLGYPKLYIVP